VGEHKPLRQLAAEKAHGQGANPSVLLQYGQCRRDFDRTIRSLLGDPTSLATELTPDGDADGGKQAASGKDQLEADPADHDNDPSVTEDKLRSKLSDARFLLKLSPFGT
jgi:hypothetical protein